MYFWILHTSMNFFYTHLVRDIGFLLKILIKNADFFMKYAFERTEISWKKYPKMCQKSVFFTLLKWKSSEFCHGSFLGQFTRAESLKKRCLFSQFLTWMVTSLVETGTRTFGTHLILFWDSKTPYWKCFFISEGDFYLILLFF